MPPFPVETLRRQFPALACGDPPHIFFDNAAGAQVPAGVIAAVGDHLLARNVQRGGPYGRSREVDATIERARRRVADLVNAPAPTDIAFGLNATSFMRMLSLAVGQSLGERSAIVVTDLDHEANVATWMALERVGARLEWWRIREDGRLHLADLEALLSPRTRLVACTMASNATGTRVDVAGAAALVHGVGAELFVDAVHFSPHGPIDVQALGCDYLVCSGYKVFGPHMGFAWCRREAADRLATFREEFIPDTMPDKLEAGTFAYENVAGMAAAIDYLEDLGRRLGGAADESARQTLRRAMDAIADYEQILSRAMLEALRGVAGVTVHGMVDPGARVPTFAFSSSTVAADALAAGLDRRGIGVRNGHMYSPRLMRRLGTPDGVVRASLVHYNTTDEVQAFATALAALTG